MGGQGFRMPMPTAGRTGPIPQAGPAPGVTMTTEPPSYFSRLTTESLRPEKCFPRTEEPRVGRLGPHPGALLLPQSSDVLAVLAF